MYLSEVHLYNWRSYADARFTFKPPTYRKPLVLLGAMNGHGKTSFLLALYLGLFGRLGLKHAESFRNADQENFTFYRDAIRKFRRSGTPSDEPTSVELVFSPTEADGNAAEIRIVRRWFFTTAGAPKMGDAFETVELYLNGQPQRLSAGLDAAHARLQRILFPAHFMPAFFFDGEQAQSLINNSGEDGIRKSVEVLFGTKVVEEAFDTIKLYIQNAHSRLGGKRNASAQQQMLDGKLEERDKLETAIADRQRQVRECEKQREALSLEQRQCQEALSRLGGDRKAELVNAHSEVENSSAEKQAAEKALTECARRFGLALAISRLAPAIRNRLEAEAARERWQGLRDGTLSRIDEVLQRALPEPAEQDDLLGFLSPDMRERVRERFRGAIEYIYHPPPAECASEYLLGHAKGEFRTRAIASLAGARNVAAQDIRARAKRLKEARERFEDARARLARLDDLPKEVEALSERLNDLGDEIADLSRQLGALENVIKKWKSDLQDVNAEIGRLQDLLAKMEPEQQRISVAEKARAVLDALSQELRPITLRRLEELVTRHFTRIADRRFRTGKILFPDGGAPALKRDGHPDALIEMMSGFERRSFGIAFSLALAEITRKRIPLVVDTPLGNADREYRQRLLREVTDVELDQIIILTHDAEVTGTLFEQIRPQVRQTFLIEYDPYKRESVVTADAYFEEVLA